MNKKLVYIGGIVIIIILISSLFIFQDQEIDVDVAQFEELKRLEFDATMVKEIKWSPDGEKIAAITSNISYIYDDNNQIIDSNLDIRVNIWDYNSGELELSLHNETPTSLILSVDWSPDGKLITATTSYELLIWEYPSGSFKNSISNSGNSIDWSPDGSKILIGNHGIDNIKIYDVESGNLMKNITGHIISKFPTEVVLGGSYADRILSVAWSPDGTRFATGSSGGDSHHGNISIWNIDTGEEELFMTGHTDWVYDVVWSPDGERIASGSHDGTVRVWDTDSGDLIYLLNASYYQVYGIDWSPNGDYIVASSSDHIEFWNMASGEKIVEYDLYPGPTGGSVSGPACSPDSSKVATGTAFGDIRIWGIP